jgi:hypothetical protein
MAIRQCQFEGPPWDTCVDPDEAYVRKQAGSMGSGLLGGWSHAAYGGSLGAHERQEDDVRKTVAKLVAAREHPPTGPHDQD